MSISSTTSAQGIAWNLGPSFYQGHDDPALQRDLERAAAAARAFAGRYRGTVAVAGGPAAAQLNTALTELEAIYDTISRVATYALLLFNADTGNQHYRNLQQQVAQDTTAVRNDVLFFELEWMALDDATAARLLADPQLATYRHHLHVLRGYAPHMLSEAEEQVINEKDRTGAHAWQQFFAERISSLSFPVEIAGERRPLSMDEVLNLLRHAERTTRQRAFEAFYSELAIHAQTFAYIYNTLLQDQITMNRLRHYETPMAARNLSDELPPEAVETMLHVTEQNYDIAHTYFALKARLLNLPRLHIYDQYAPIGDTRIQRSFDEAQQIVLAALARFDARLHDAAAEFFTARRIDAEIRGGKSGGAFCSGYPPSVPPYILCNYTDDIRDVMTLAHELGHGVHFVLAARQTLFNFYPTTPMAETASVFAEMLTVDYLLEHETDPQVRLALLCSQIEDMFSTIFRQNVLTRFEQAAYSGRVVGRMTPEEICDHWTAANAPYYGAVVEQTAGYELGWSYIPHFINTPFYCYSYVFGNLLVLALYSMYREQGSAFVPTYTALLEAGASASPAALLARLEIDICAASFWQRGFDELRRLVGQVQQTVTQD